MCTYSLWNPHPSLITTYPVSVASYLKFSPHWLSCQPGLVFLGYTDGCNWRLNQATAYLHLSVCVGHLHAGIRFCWLSPPPSWPPWRTPDLSENCNCTFKACDLSSKQFTFSGYVNKFRKQKAKTANYPASKGIGPLEFTIWFEDL